MASSTRSGTCVPAGPSRKIGVMPSRGMCSAGNCARKAVTFSIVLRRLFLFPRLRLMFPAAVQPEILFRGRAHQVLQVAREALRDGANRVRRVIIFLGQNE